MSTWEATVVADSDGFVVSRQEELRSEWQMLLHFHGSRKQRVEEDVHNVRAAELVAHKRWMARHVSGMEDKFKSEKSRFQELQASHNADDGTYTSTMTTLKEKVLAAIGVKEMQDLRALANKTTDTFQTGYRTSLRQYRQSLDDSLRALREANGLLRTSIRSFSEGGNFSTGEIETFRAALEAVRMRIDDVESQILGELDNIEGKHNRLAADVMFEINGLLDAGDKDVVLAEAVKSNFAMTQLKIKSEVNKSNSDSGEIESSLALLISACSTSTDNDAIVSSIKVLAGLFKARVGYLECSALAPLKKGESKKRMSRTGVILQQQAPVNPLATATKPKSTGKPSKGESRGAEQQYVQVSLIISSD